MHVVVNWLWQGVALTLLTDVAMRSAPRVSASARYVLWWVAMILVLLLPAMPTLVALSGAPPVSAAAPPLSPLPLPDVPVWPLLAAVGCWVFWIAAFLARLSVSIASLGRVRRDATSFPPGREGRLEHWVAARTSNGRSARLVLSSRVKSASVIGLGPALIAVSPEALERLTDDELDQVVLHEWAHVQRRDDYARLIQLAIRCIAGLHPAVWWIGRRLEIEREIACDDYAVNITGGARAPRCVSDEARRSPAGCGGSDVGAWCAPRIPADAESSAAARSAPQYVHARVARGAGIRGERADIRRGRSRTCRARRRRIAGRRTHGRSARARDSLAAPGVRCADSVRHGMVHARACDAAGDSIAGRASGSRLAGTIRRAECGVLRRAGAPVSIPE